MCEIWKRDELQEIGVHDFERQLESIDELGVEWVVFSGGEALMHAGLFRMCERLRERKIRITILSSGLLLSRFADEIVRYADEVTVSLDGPPAVHNEIRRVAKAFELLEDGVAALRSLRPDFPVYARCTVQRRNCGHLVETMRAARRIGLNSISFLAADVHSEAFNRTAADDSIALTENDLPILDAQIEALVECGDFVAESPAKLRKIARHFRAYLGLAAHEAPRCNAPWTSAVVEADGSVRPCFFHASVGRLSPGVDLAQIVNGFEATAFRAGLNVATNPVCRRCVCSLNRAEDAQTAA